MFLPYLMKYPAKDIRVRAEITILSRQLSIIPESKLLLSEYRYEALHNDLMYLLNSVYPVPQSNFLSHT